MFAMNWSPNITVERKCSSPSFTHRRTSSPKGYAAARDWNTGGCTAWRQPCATDKQCGVVEFHQKLSSQFDGRRRHMAYRPFVRARRPPFSACAEQTLPAPTRFRPLCNYGRYIFLRKFSHVFPFCHHSTIKSSEFTMKKARVGIELEFMVAYRPEPAKDKSAAKDTRWPDCADARFKSDARGFYHKSCMRMVCETLAALDLPAACYVERNRHRDDPLCSGHEARYIESGGLSPLRVWNQHLANEDGSRPQFNYWFVSHESYITQRISEQPPKHTPQGYHWCAMEISTPILSDQEELDTRLPTVKRVLAALRKDMKIWLNAECGLHIHLSPLVLPLSFELSKRIAAVVCVLEEPFLQSITHPFRHETAFAVPITYGSCIAETWFVKSAQPTELPVRLELIKQFRETMDPKFRAIQEPRVFKILCAVMAQETMMELKIGLLRPSKTDPHMPTGRCAAAIRDCGPCTVEIRYPEASFDCDFIALWVDVARRMLVIAQQPDGDFAEELRRLYELATRETPLERDEWLSALGLGSYAALCKDRASKYRGCLRNLGKEGILKICG